MKRFIYLDLFYLIINISNLKRQNEGKNFDINLDNILFLDETTRPNQYLKFI